MYLTDQPILPTQKLAVGAQAARLLAAGNDAPQRHSVPPYVAQRGEVLLVTTDVGSPPDLVEIEQLSERHNLDVVLGRYDPSAALPLKVVCGVRLWWRLLWHANYLPFLPEDGGAMVFVAEDPCVGMHFRIEEGRLEACDWVPYSDAVERSTGLEHAAARIRRLVEGA